MKKLLLLVPILLFLCCGGKSGTEYYPMGVGSVWNYEFYTVNVSSTSTDTIQKGWIETKATKEDKLSSGEDVVEFVQKCSTLVHMPPSPDTIIVTFDTTYAREHQDYILVYETKADNSPDTALALPLEKDKTWRQNAYATVKVLGQENVSVKAGDYQDAWKLEATMTNPITMSVYSWLAEGVGHVKTHYEYEPIQGFKQIYNMELVSADIK